jgi:hypothetical protein
MYFLLRSFVGRFLCLSFVCLVCIVGTGLLHQGHAASASSPAKNTVKTSATCGGWNAGPVPGKGQLNSVAAISSTDVWAVGNTNNSATPVKSIIMHYDGTAWSLIPHPNPYTSFNILNGVAAVTSNDVWAVGNASNSSHTNFQTLIEHYDGSKWSIVPTSNPSTMQVLTTVTAISATDVWAVGYSYISSTAKFQTLIENWNGTTWSIVPSPVFGKDNVLHGISASTATDIWAVGGQQPHKTLIEHYDGTSWSVVPSPSASFGGIGNVLEAVAVVPGTNQVWAVGSAWSQNTQRSISEFYNGSTWRLVATTAGNDYLGSVVAFSSNDLMAVGGGDALEWDGWKTRWTSTPFTPSAYNLWALSEVPGTHNLWAVGEIWNSDESKIQPVSEFYC